MLLHRAGTTIYIAKNGSVHQTTSLTSEEVANLNTQNLNEREIMLALGVDLSDSEIVNELEESGLFEIDGSSIYRKGIKLSVPKLLAEKYVESLDNESEINALDNFWKWCALNPNPEARQNLFEYLVTNGLEVTDSGLIVTYRNVNVKSQGNQELHNFIVNQHLLVRTKWKKSTKNYLVIESHRDNSLSLVKVGQKYNSNNTNYGTLNSCYKNLEDLTGTIYTDAHTGKMRYKLGVEARMPRKDCDSNSANLCSASFHCGSLKYMSKGNFGKVGVICLVNPMDVVSIPNETNFWKMRTCAFMPIALAEYDENRKITNPITEMIEDVYTQVCVDNLNQELENVNLQEYKVNTLNIENVANMVLDVTDAMRDQVIKKTVDVYEL